MDTKIDWLSWTSRSPVVIDEHSALYDAAKLILSELGRQWNAYIFDGTSFDVGQARPPYRLGLERADRGVRIFGGGRIDNILFELTGRACEGLRVYDSAAAFIAPLVAEITRVDVAVDVRTGTRPSVFGNDRTHHSFRSLSFIRSDTGETVYVGSPKSDRFCRVYRYNEPHPRSELLRVEYVFRRGLAKAAAQSLLDAGSFEKFIASAGNTYGFQHADWQPGVLSEERLKAPTVTRDDNDTLGWLYKSVLPAMKRVYQSGALDLDDWTARVIENA